jgi:DNA-binding transcriptional MocR family regulator
MSERRRIEVMELAARHRVLVLEDDAYGDIAFEGARLPSLAAVTGGPGVLSVGTFSKTIATGLRVGWVRAEPQLVERISRMRFDMGSSPLLHYMLAAFIESGDFDAHVARVRELYARKARALGRALVDLAEPYLSFTAPAGGFFLWVRLRDGLTADALQRAAIEEGVIFPIGYAFFPDRIDTDGEHIRLAYSWTAESELVEAAARIARACERVAASS